MPVPPTSLLFGDLPTQSSSQPSDRGRVKLTITNDHKVIVMCKQIIMWTSAWGRVDHLWGVTKNQKYFSRHGHLTPLAFMYEESKTFKAWLTLNLSQGAIGFWFWGVGEIDPKWPLNKRFSKIGQNLPEGDIFIKQVKNPLYLRNIGDKKWSPFMDLCYEKVPFLHLKSPKVTVLAYKKKRDLRRLNPKTETTFCRQHSLNMKDLTPVWYGYHL